MKGNLIAIASIGIWSSLYVSSEILLKAFTPSFLFMLQAVIGLIIMLIARPSFKKLKLKQEALLIVSSLSGIVFYNLGINFSLLYTSAVNTSFLILLAPLFVLFAILVISKKKVSLAVWIGSFLALIGSAFLSFTNGITIKLVGDFLAIIAAIFWAVYTLVVARKELADVDETLKVQRMLLYALPLAILQFAVIDGQLPAKDVFFEAKIVLNLLLVSMFSTGFCYLMWNYSAKLTSAERVSQYVYLTPIFTTATAIIFTSYTLTIQIAIGGFLILTGIILSNRGLK